MYDPKTAKAEASQRSLLKIVDGGHVLADHSFDHMNHNSNDSPRNAYTNVEQDMVSLFLGLNQTGHMSFLTGPDTQICQTGHTGLD